MPKALSVGDLETDEGGVDDRTQGGRHFAEAPV